MLRHGHARIRYRTVGWQLEVGWRLGFAVTRFVPDGPPDLAHAAWRTAGRGPRWRVRFRHYDGLAFPLRSWRSCVGGRIDAADVSPGHRESDRCAAAVTAGTGHAGHDVSRCVQPGYGVTPHVQDPRPWSSLPARPSCPGSRGGRVRRRRGASRWFPCSGGAPRNLSDTGAGRIRRLSPQRRSRSNARQSTRASRGLCQPAPRRRSCATAPQGSSTNSTLAVTTTYLRRLEGQEDRGWRSVAETIGIWAA
jgi:hypothetical protein